MSARTLPAFGPLTTARYAVSGVGFDMVRVPPGRFIDGEDARRRELLVSRPFEIGATQVTQALWQAVTGLSPSKFSAPDRPVEQVSWDDAQDFLSRLRVLGLSGFRLPTEAESVWAARCGVSTRWAGSDRTQAVALSQAQQTALVAGLSPSPTGAFDLSGNVSEWQSDWLLTPAMAGVDVQGPPSGFSHAYRGGGWDNGAQGVRVARRGSSSPSFRYDSLGLRLLRTGP